MRWFRPRISLGAYLTLAALALNVAFSFSHHHFGEAAPRHITTGADQAAAENSTDAHSGGDRDNDHHDPSSAHPCLTCIVVAAAAIDASPPALPSRRRAQSIAVAAIASTELRESVRTAFEARAPPHS